MTFPIELPPNQGMHDGNHTVEQFSEVFGQSFGMTAQQIKAIFYTVDKDKSISLNQVARCRIPNGAISTKNSSSPLPPASLALT